MKVYILYRDLGEREKETFRAMVARSIVTLFPTLCFFLSFCCAQVRTQRIEEMKDTITSFTLNTTFFDSIFCDFASVRIVR